VRNGQIIATEAVDAERRVRWGMAAMCTPPPKMALRLSKKGSCPKKILDLARAATDRAARCS
jgi:hypothetical protein